MLLPIMAGLSLLATTGCVNLGPGTTNATRLYVLAPLAVGAATAERGASPGAVVGVGPLAFPDYLNRPQIVTRRGTSEIVPAAFANWAEPLGPHFLRVLTNNLALLMGSERVYAHPWRSTLKPAYRVELDVIRFDAEQSGEAVLAVRWEILDARGNPRRPKTKAEFRHTLAGNEPAAVVMALSRVLGDFSRTLAVEIAALN
jgi:uncharacterized lipoprotein YmbA